MTIYTQNHKADPVGPSRTSWASIDVRRRA